MVKKQINKLLDASVVYLTFESKLVSLVQCVPNKYGITIVPNKKNELIPMRSVMSWSVCIDYRKLNS